MISVQNVSRLYQDFVAVDGINFTIHKNEIVALIGLNGAGKTTTLRMLSGYLSPSSGSINVGNISSQDDGYFIRQNIGFLPEKPALYHDMTVYDFLIYMYRIRKLSKENEQQSVEKVLHDLELQDRRHQVIATLSMGYKKRVALAQALVHQPEILLLDEPFADLDPQQIIEIRNLIVSLKNNHCILLSSHLLTEVDKLADRYLFIHQGKIIAQESKESIVQALGSGHRYSALISFSQGDLPEHTGDVAGVIQDKLAAILPNLSSLQVAKASTANQFLISIKSDAEMRAEISRAIISLNYDLLEIHAQKENLENFFMRLTEKKSA